jgi:hypothetical protein
MAGRYAILVLALFVAAGCGSSKQARWIDQVEKEDVSERELRLRLMDYLREFGGAVGVSANEIRDRSDDPELRMKAYQWKSGMVLAAQTAAFQPDPVAGLLNLWTLVLQLKIFFREGAGKELFGEHQQIAVVTTDHLYDEIQHFEPFLPGENPAETKAKIAQWAAAHPLKEPHYARRSPAADLAKTIGDPNLSAFAVVESLDERMNVLMERMQFYIETMPPIARLQAEQTGELFLNDKRVVASREDLAVMAVSLDRLSSIEDRLPEIIGEQVLEKTKPEIDRILGKVDDQRVATLDAVTKEREAIFESVKELKASTVETVQNERELILAKVDEQVASTIETVQKERELIFAEVDKQRLDTLAQVRQLTEDSLDRSMSGAKSLIHAFFWGVALAGGALIAVWFVARLALTKASRSGT